MYPLPVAGPRYAAQDLQYLIDNADDNTRVIPPAGTYPITETIVCRDTISLDLSNVVLQAVADVDIIQCKPQAHIQGGYIDCSGVTFTHAALVFDGTDHFSMVFPTFIRGVQLLGNYQTDGATGKGIYIHGEQGVADKFVYGVLFDNIGISYFQYGIHFLATPTSGVKFVTLNGNGFSNIAMSTCRYAISLNPGAGMDIDGNTFTNIQIQYGTGGTRALYSDGNFNMYNNFMVWDWVGDTTIELVGNYSTLITSIYSTKVLNTGYNNNVQAITP
jgi:hypothetical protein